MNERKKYLDNKINELEIELKKLKKEKTELDKKKEVKLYRLASCNETVTDWGCEYDCYDVLIPVIEEFITYKDSEWEDGHEITTVNCYKYKLKDNRLYWIKLGGYLSENPHYYLDKNDPDLIERFNSIKEKALKGTNEIILNLEYRFKEQLEEAERFKKKVLNININQ